MGGALRLCDIEAKGNEPVELINEIPFDKTSQRIRLKSEIWWSIVMGTYLCGTPKRTYDRDQVDGYIHTRRSTGA
jgi:hypothetical protein